MVTPAIRPGGIVTQDIIGWERSLVHEKTVVFLRIRGPIYFYRDKAHHTITMYLIIRCPGCKAFTYVDRFQRWKLCPVCGHAHEVSKAPAYLEVEDYTEAEHIVKQMEKHLHTTKKTDFTPEETIELRHHYTEALKKKLKGHHA
jgi:acetyl-CoA carboxylase beta subunit